MLKILIPTDFSENAHAALRYAAQLAATLQAELVLAHVLRIPWYPAETPQEVYQVAMEHETRESHAGLQQQAQHLRHELAARGQQVQVTTRIVAAAFAEGLQQLAAQEQCRLIVMGTKGATGLKRMFIGSNTTDLMEHTRVPLIIVPQQYEFTGMQRIVLALELDKPHTLSPHLKVVRRLAHAFSSEVILLSVIKRGQQFTPHRQQFTQEMKQRLGQATLFYLNIPGNNPTETITEYAALDRPELLVLHPQRRSVWQLLFDKRLTREMAFGPEVPIMVMPLPDEE